MKKIVLIPAYEPTKLMIELLKKLSKKDLEIVIVNDGSDNRFDKIFLSAKKYGVVLGYESNMGKGFAIKTGLKYISENYDDYIVVTVDCDGQHSVEDTLNMLEVSLKYPNDLIIGKRLRDKKIPFRSKLGNSITKIVYKLVTGVYVYDTQSGLRSFSERLVPFLLSVNGDRFEYEMNVLLLCPRNKIKIREFDIKTIYIDNNSGSHFNPFKDSFRIYSEIIKKIFIKK